MDVKLINPFINATIYVLETMAFVKVTPGKPYVKKGNIAVGDVTGIFGLTGIANGTIALTFEEKCILTIVSNMSGEPMDTLNDSISDALRELTSMISSQARRELEQVGKVLKAATPSVVTGKNHSIRHYSEGSKIAIPFNTDGGDFTIEVCFER